MKLITKYLRIILFLLLILIPFSVLSVYKNYGVKKNNNNEKIRESIKLGYEWFVEDVNPKTDRLQYMYFPKIDAYSKLNSDIRQLMAAWSLIRTQKFLNENKLDYVIKNTIDFYLKKGAPTIAHNAAFILVLLDFDYPNKNVLIEGHAKEILSLQNSDGSFFMSKTDKRIDYPKMGTTPGEVTLALIKLFKKTKNDKYLQATKKAFNFYSNYWKKKPYFYVHWQTQAYYLLYKETKDPEVSKFIFEINDWVAERLPKNNNTAAIMEGLSDAYLLAKELNDQKRIKRYETLLKAKTPLILSLQIDEKKANKFKNPRKAVGGFYFSADKFPQLIDFTFHSLNALIKIYENKIF